MDMIMYKVNRTVNNVYKYIKDWVDGLFVKKNNDAGYILIDRNGEKYMAYEEIWEME
jgi:predicted transcriptional regulator